MAGKNKNLNASRSANNDEFYTQLRDIEAELVHYERHFKGKTVLCNCDDPFESNFFKYFVMNFKKLGLKKFIATCYDGSVASEYRGVKSRPYKAVVTRVDGRYESLTPDSILELLDLSGNELTDLKGNGDF